ncbi:MAG TPA: hypothetical protein VJ508_10830 [Saprospiraceae bacterium]|nr:hypothetical protein [Saprospiraceae bacterium]
MCEHLIGLDEELKRKGIKELFRGQAWSDNSRQWVYYDCLLDLEAIRQRFHFPNFILNHVNDDPKSGTEAGFVCMHCHDAVMGFHPDYAEGKAKIH